MEAIFECRVLVLMVIVLSFLLNLGYGINLDARFSIIRKGQENSYFGYSVAQHQIVNDADDDGFISPKEFEDIVENVLLVGAPKEKVQEGGHTFGGALYRCDASRTPMGECLKITDNVYTAPRSREVVDDQWFGVSVASGGKGKKAVTCAHRYIQNNAAMGVCYTLLQNLEIFNPYKPCQRMSHTSYMQDFGLCQVGLSTSLGEDDSLLMGAPGSIFWQGAIFFTNISEEYGVSQTEIVSPYKEQDKLEANEQATPVNRYSYQGYSTDMGRFDSTKALYYVSGAPTSHKNGEVVFYRKINSVLPVLRYEPDQIIRGSRPFSGFGSSLLAVDLNNDGFDELIVGAPYYYQRNYGGAIYVYRGGSDMITADTEPVEILSRQMGDEECIKLRCEHARFGISLTKLGDINMDGFQDFAVGAPYEGNGAVYIYHGQDSETGFTSTYVQRIVASDLPVPDLMSFGHSLSGGIDLDGNGYPDLLVGAYESDAVALIRSRPIIRIYPSISVSPKLIDLEATPQCNLPGVKAKYRNRHCVGVELCLNFTTKPENSLSTLPQVIYRLDAEKPRRIARVELQDAMDVNMKVVEGKTINLNPTSSVCTTEIALIKGSFEDKLNPITFTFTFGLSTDSATFEGTYPSYAQVDINAYPILDTLGNSAEVNTAPVEVDFVKECGPDNECHSDLQFTSQLQSPYDDLEKTGENEFEMVIKATNELQLILGVTNRGEPAYLTRIYVQKPPLVSFQGIESTSAVICTDMKNNDSMIICDHIGNPLRTDKSVFFNMLLDIPREMAESDDMYTITTWVNTSSTETSPLNDREVAKFKLINKADISVVTNVVPDHSIPCSGEPLGASAITDESKIGPSVKHNFIVTNAGPGVISESYITIHWPYEVSGPKGGAGKYLLYMMRKPQISGPVVKCNDDEIEQYINPLKITEVNTDELPDVGASKDIPIQVKDVRSVSNETNSPSRYRRETEPQSSARGGVIVMNCRDKSATCFLYKCKIGKLEAKNDLVRITMDSRLWVSTLLSDYRDAAEVQMISWAKITLPSSLKIQQDTSNDQKRAITRAVPDFKESSKTGLQWWIILVAVLAGVVLLLIVIFILYKLGFFRRRRPEEMQMFQAEKTQQPMLSEYQDDEL